MNEGLLAGIQRCPTKRRESAVRYDAASGGFPRTSYLGKAKPGSLDSQAVWSIQRIVEQSGGDIDIKWADGNQNEDNVWNNRASLVYS